MNKKLIAIDLDGTTLNQDSMITSKTKETLKKAINAGHHVSIATGRPFRMSHQFYQQLELTTPMVNFNGALVHIPNQHWDGERETLINREIAFEILSQKKQLNLDFIAAENRDTFFIDSFDFFDEKTFASSRPGEKNLLSPKNLTTNPTSLLVRTDKRFAGAVSAELTRQFGSYVDVRTWGGPTAILEIVSKGIQKAKGVQEIANYLSIDQKDVIAFGDEHNDLELLDYAGWGVAMANGTDQLKGIANDVTPLSNQEDGLAVYLEKLLKL
ncbi:MULTISPECIES: Cof-type HAD-IIB family hydrolase [Enterococcus]|uniref:Cof-type HAD-IIB family hydrolase n=1 Tax=Enterococcus TaxID=1350 RepID=UPI000280DA63|nr:MULTISPECIES: Cof-type HAD-IIB family hydrolase [Enterococcus]EKA01911.1 HAD superfamily hydrolase [Enterococcus sp. GMD4E]EKA04804.1 HAD superfamily hydrolase [Enterococcus sp. GMD3E]EKA09853.1 HAD superfamily hydrolase [Enterococcus sp. GMD2E]EKQ77460.1 HAD superfamily hydrolase [Enterococcus sp. GMD5E]EKA15816.1 HAD superfamily hydrolase [Enterococcus sp. GMD1E]